MAFDPGDGLTDELADQIRLELEADDAGEETREQAAVRRGGDDRVELVAHDDEGGEATDVVVSLSGEQAIALAAALVEAAAPSDG